MQIEYPITFLYYTDLDPVVPFYRDVLGLDLQIDQGWAKIFRLNDRAYVGLVDESRGSMTATGGEGVLLTLVVEDVDAWYRHMRDNGVTIVTPPTTHEDIGVYCFFAEDPGGYRIEIQKFLD
ncbi:MAG: VOC family protein [Clostridia bacterium]